MAEYYTSAVIHAASVVPSGVYFHLSFPEREVTITPSSRVIEVGSQRITACNVTGDGSWETDVSLWVWKFDSSHAVQNFTRDSLGPKVMSEVTDGSSPILYVSGLGNGEPVESGKYLSPQDPVTELTPVKAPYIFSPESFTMNPALGQCVYVLWTGYDGRPTLVSPFNGAVNQDLNTAHLKEMIYDDAEPESFSAYTVHFSVDGGSIFIPRDDRSRYSLLTYKMFLDVTLEYGTTYYWFVRKTINDTDYDSETWSFTTIDFFPPLPTGVTLDAEGNPTGTALGLNNMMTVKRLVAVADNKVYYET